MRFVFVLLAATLIAVGAGCSISNSSQSISDSISSPSESISNSSESSSDSSNGGGGDDAPAPEPAAETASYQRDVSELTRTYLETGGDVDAYRAAVAGLAEDRGITDWEADAATTNAIGHGAGAAGLDERAFTAFVAELVGDHAARGEALRRGYEQVRKSAAAGATRALDEAAATDDAS